MRLGVLGGSFDPIHMGHLRAAELACSQLGLGQVAFVPAYQSPHKPAPLANAAERYTMACLATAGHAQFVVLDLELRRGGESYTVDTLLALRAARPADELVLVLGSDSLGALASWREADRILELSALAVVARPGSVPPDSERLEFAGARLVWVHGPALQISSSELREQSRLGRSIRYLVPDSVHEYIGKRRLYK